MCFIMVIPVDRKIKVQTPTFAQSLMVFHEFSQIIAIDFPNNFQR